MDDFTDVTTGRLVRARGGDQCERVLLGGPVDGTRPDRGLFRLEGDYWTVVFAGRVVRLRDGKGLRYLAPLLYRPGQGVHVVDLQALGSGTGRPLPLVDRSPSATERARVAVAKAIKSALGRIATAHPELGEHLAGNVRRGFVCSVCPGPARSDRLAAVATGAGEDRRRLADGASVRRETPRQGAAE